MLPYFQDEWKLRPNITLNLGIRWEYYSVIAEAHDRMTIFDPTCSGGVLPGTNTPVPNICPKGSPAYFPNYRNFDPRVGISWAPTALHDKTVVRAGFGIYHGAGIEKLHCRGRARSRNGQPRSRRAATAERPLQRCSAELLDAAIRESDIA